MILITPKGGASHVKFCDNIEPAPRFALRSVVQYIMYTVIHCMTRASEASGFSTVGAYCEWLRICLRMLQNVSIACIRCDTVLYYKCGGDDNI